MMRTKRHRKRMSSKSKFAQKTIAARDNVQSSVGIGMMSGNNPIRPVTMQDKNRYITIYKLSNIRCCMVCRLAEAFQKSPMYKTSDIRNFGL